MADSRHVEMLKSDLKQWQGWRDKNPDVRPDLSKASLRGAHLDNIDLHKADLTGADLTHAFFHEANLCEADLSGAVMAGTNFCRADLRGAILKNADLHRANFDRADLSGADLSRAKLELAILVGSKVAKTIFTGCRVYGLSAWGLDLETVADQSDLRITREDEPNITVSNLEVAQFIYLLLNNQHVRQVIDTITSKVVLILGRFTPERKAVLDSIRIQLRTREYTPVLFDFEKPASRDLTETVSTLAHMARFVIADITDAKSIPQELMAIVPNLPSVPVQPLLLASQREYGMFDHIKRYPWVLEPFLYEGQDQLLASLDSNVIGPAEARARKL